MDKILLVAFDPSMRNTAYAGMLISKSETKCVFSGVIETEKTKIKSVRVSSDTVQRCSEMFSAAEQIKSTTKELAHENNALVLWAGETPSGSQSAASMKSYGISCFFLAMFDGLIEVTPLEVKRSTVGSKTATKREMIDWAFEKHPEANWGKLRNGKPMEKMEHLADAICVSYAAMKTGEGKRFAELFNY